MRQPVNFHSYRLDLLIADWLLGLKPYSVDVIVVLGPLVPGDGTEREVLAVHPPPYLAAAQDLASSHEFGSDWLSSRSSLVVWQDITKSAAESEHRWRRLCMAAGMHSMVRVSFELMGGAAFECYMFSPRALHERAEAAALAWSAQAVWPLLRQMIAKERKELNDKEVECLRFTMLGQTAAQVAQTTELSERSVNFHLSCAMQKLKTETKVAAALRAHWIGYF
jgi:DNA-binding CsgD family transcriptional regulator/uncharacterized protein YciI